MIGLYKCSIWRKVLNDSLLSDQWMLLQTVGIWVVGVEKVYTLDWIWLYDSEAGK